MMQFSTRRLTCVLLLLIAAVLSGGCQMSAPPPLTDAPAATTGPATQQTPISAGGSRSASASASVDHDTALACEVSHIMLDTTSAALQHQHDAAALAKLYGEAATKLRGVAARAAGTRLAQPITDIAVAVDGIARHFATGSLQPPDTGKMDKAFEALPPCTQR